MKPSSLPCLAFVMVAVLCGGKAQAGLAEATDYVGPWSYGSSSSYSSAANLELWKQRIPGLDGVDAAAGELEGIEAEYSWMETTVTGPGVLYFSHRVQDFSTGYGASFQLRVNGGSPILLQRVEPNGGSGALTTTDWKEAAIPIGDGDSTVRWELSAFRGSLGGFALVDQVWTSRDPRPRITSTSTSGMVSDPLDWEVSVQSASAFTLRASDLPPGLLLSADGRSIVGTPSLSGTFLSKLSADNAAGTHVAEVSFNILPDTSTSIPEGLDWPLQEFAQGVAAPWTGMGGFGFVDNDCVRGETHAWRTQDIAGAGLSTTVEGPGTFSFWYYCEGQFPSNGAVIMYFAGPPTSPLSPTSVFYEGGKWTKASIQIPAGRRLVSLVPYRQLTNPGGPEPSEPVYAYIDGMTFESSAAEIAVIAGAGGPEVSNGDSRSFGPVSIGGGAAVDFTIQSVTSSSLTGLGTTIEGPDASSFSLVTAPVAPVQGPDGTTTFSVRFAPVGTGTKTARLRIESNDPDENPFEIVLVGQGTTIASSPVSREVGVGEPVAFSVGSNAAGATYQWRKDGRDIPGAVGASLELPSAHPWDGGEYSVVVTSAAGVEESAPASLRLRGVPEGIWRGLVSYYPFDGNPTDVIRPASPAELVNGASLVTDPVRGGVAFINGLGFVVPPLPSEPPNVRGPGGSIRIPRPIEARGESFTISFWIRERGYSSWHGESFLTLGEGAAAPALLGHYYVGGFEGQLDHYGANGTLILETVPPGTAVVTPDGGAVISQPVWRDWTVVGSGETLKFYSQGVYKGSLAYPAAVAGDVFLGRHWWVDGGLRYSTRFQGEMDEVRFYNRALSEEEVRQLSVATQPVPPPHAYDAWAQANGLTGAEAGLGADPDGDGWTNCDEFVFGTQPRVATPDVARFFAATPWRVLEWIGRRDVQFSSAASHDLRDWQPFGAPVVPTIDQSGVPTGYRRLRVEMPPPPNQGAPLLRAVRAEGMMAPFLVDSGRLEMKPPTGESPIGGEVVIGPASGLPWESYRWRKEGVQLLGQTQPTLRIASVQKEHSGVYQLIVTNALGEARSQEAFLRVTAPLAASVNTVSHTTPGAGRVTVVGLVVDDGGQPVLERGVVFGPTPDSTVEGGLVIPSGHGPGYFEATAAGVVPGAPLFARAYARTSLGVAYGENRSVGLP